MADVFISYSRKNSAFARRLIDRLILAGKDTWVDWEGIPLTSPNWWAEIRAGIQAADNFLFILTPDSMASVVCNMELDYAIELRKRIIPVVYQDVVTRDAFASIADFSPDEAMSERLAGKDPLLVARENWQRLSHINWLFFRDEDDFDTAFARLITTVETDLDYVKAHTRYLVRAEEWQREQQRADLLLFGEEIDRAETWLQQAEAYAAAAEQSGANPLPGDLHREYIRVSRVADRRRRRLLRNLRVGTLTFATVGVIAVLLALASFLSLQNTQTRADLAATQAAEAGTAIVIANHELAIAYPILTQGAQEIERIEARFESLRLASLAQSVVAEPTGNMEVVALLGIQALKTAYTSQADSVLIYALDNLFIKNRLRGGADGVLSVVFSPDGRSVLSTNHRMLILQDRATGEMLHSFFGHTDKVTSVAFSPNGHTILSSSCAERGDFPGFCTRGEFILWDMMSVETEGVLVFPLLTFTGHTGEVTSVAFAPDGTTALSGSWDNTLILWDVATGEMLRTFTGHTNTVHSVAFSPDGRYALSGSSDLTLRLWDVATGEALRTFIGHTDTVHSVVFSPDGRYALSGSSDLTLRLWELDTGETLRTFTGHIGTVTSVAFAPDGMTILSGSGDKTGRLWNVTTGQILHTFSGHTERVTSVAFSPDGQTALSGSSDGNLILWTGVNTSSLDMAMMKRPRMLTGHTERVTSVAFSPDGQTALCQVPQK